MSQSAAGAFSAVDLSTLDLLMKDVEGKLLFLEQHARSLVEGVPFFDSNNKVADSQTQHARRQPLSKRLKPFLAAVRAANTIEAGEDPDGPTKKALKLEKERFLQSVDLTEATLRKLHEYSKRFTESISLMSDDILFDVTNIDASMQHRMPFVAFVALYPRALFIDKKDDERVDADTSFTINTTLTSRGSMDDSALLPLKDVPEPSISEEATATHITRHGDILKKDMSILVALAGDERARLAELRSAAAALNNGRGPSPSLSDTEAGSSKSPIIAMSRSASPTKEGPGGSPKPNGTSRTETDERNLSPSRSPKPLSNLSAAATSTIYLSILPPLPPLPTWVRYLRTADERDHIRGLHQKLSSQLESIGGEEKGDEARSSDLTNRRDYQPEMVVIGEGSVGTRTVRLNASQSSIAEQLQPLRAAFAEWYRTITSAEAYLSEQFIPSLEQRCAATERRQGYLKADYDMTIAELHNRIKTLHSKSEASELEASKLKSLLNDAQAKHRADVSAKEKELKHLQHTLDSSLKREESAVAAAESAAKELQDAKMSTTNSESPGKSLKAELISQINEVKRLTAERDLLTDKLRQSERTVQQATRDATNLREQLLAWEANQRQRRFSVSTTEAADSVTTYNRHRDEGNRGSVSFLAASDGNPLLWPPPFAAGGIVVSPTAARSLNASQWDSVGPNVSTSMDDANYPNRLGAVANYRSAASELRSAPVLLFARDDGANKNPETESEEVANQPTIGGEESLLTSDPRRYLRHQPLSSLAPVAFTRSHSAPIGSRATTTTTTPLRSEGVPAQPTQQSEQSDEKKETIHGNASHLINKRLHQRHRDARSEQGPQRGWVSPARFDAMPSAVASTTPSRYYHHSSKSTAYMNTSLNSINDKVKNNISSHTSAAVFEAAPRLGTPRGSSRTGSSRPILTKPRTTSATSTPNHSPIRAAKDPHSLHLYQSYGQDKATARSLEDTIPPVPRVATPRPTQ